MHTSIYVHVLNLSMCTKNVTKANKPKIRSNIVDKGCVKRNCSSNFRAFCYCACTIGKCIVECDRIRGKAFFVCFYGSSFISSGETKLRSTPLQYNTPRRHLIEVGDLLAGRRKRASLLYNIMSIHVDADRDIITPLYL